MAARPFTELRHTDKTLLLATHEDVARCARAVVASAETTRVKLLALAETRDSLGFLHSLKFERAGTTPFNDGSLNIIEQLNQVFTYLASFRAAHYLLKHLPEFGPYRLNLGTQSGFDIESADGVSVAGEVFAAVTPSNNNKLNKDARRLSQDAAGYAHRYVFYYSRAATRSPIKAHPRYESVTVVPLDGLTFKEA